MLDLSEGGGDKNTKHQESINDLEFSEEGGGDETKTEEGDKIVDIKDERGTPPAGSSASVLQSLNIQLSVIAAALNSLLLLRLSASVWHESPNTLPHLMNYKSAKIKLHQLTLLQFAVIWTITFYSNDMMYARKLSTPYKSLNVDDTKILCQTQLSFDGNWATTAVTLKASIT